MQQLKRDTSEEFLGKYEVVFGQHLDATDPQLSPKVKHLVQEKMDLEQIFDAPDDSPKDKNLMMAAPNTTESALPASTSLDTMLVKDSKLQDP